MAARARNSPLALRRRRITSRLLDARPLLLDALLRLARSNAQREAALWETMCSFGVISRTMTSGLGSIARTRRGVSPSSAPSV